jgi:hypothetical protein
VNIKYSNIFVINYTYGNKDFKKFYFLWIKIKLRVLTFNVFLLKDVRYFFYTPFLTYNEKYDKDVFKF